MVEVDIDVIAELLDNLTILIDEEELSLKVRTALNSVKDELQLVDLSVEAVLKIQDDLENISNMNNLNDFCRNELMNCVATIESMINS